MPVFLLLGAVLPLLITPGLLFHYDMTPKSAVLAVAAAMLLLRQIDFSGLWARRSGRALVWVALCQVAWFGVTAATSTRPLLSVFGSSWRQFGLIATIALMAVCVGVAAELCARPAGVRTLLRCMACAGIACALYGIMQYFDLDPFQKVAGYHANAGDSVIVRPPGTMGHADYFGWWLAVEFFAGLAVAGVESSRWKAAGIACAAMCGVATLLTGTRAAMLAILIGVAVLFLMRGVRFGARQAWVSGAVVVLLAAFYLSPAGTRLRARVVWSGDEPAGGARPLLWRDSLGMVAARPVFGFGPETYLSAFPRYESEQLARKFPAFHHESPHNVAVESLAQSGVPGLVLVLAWGLVAVMAGRAARISGSPMAAPLVAGVAASAVASMFSGLFLWPVLATLLLVAVLVSLEKPCLKKQSHFAFGGAWMPIVRGVVSAALVAHAATLLYVDYRVEQFAKYPTIANLRLSKWPVPGVAEDVYESRILAATCPKAFGVARLECQGAATEAAGRAVRTADDMANAWYNLAMFTAAMDDIRGTQSTLEKAVNASPNWFQPHWILARLYQRTGDKPNAVREATRAAYLDAGHDAEVTQTAAELK